MFSLQPPRHISTLPSAVAADAKIGRDGQSKSKLSPPRIGKLRARNSTVAFRDWPQPTKTTAYFAFCQWGRA